MKASRADVAELLLKAGANPNIMDFSHHVNSHTRMTPAHDVARQGYLDTLRCLVKYGADVTLRDATGNTPAHLAGKQGHYHIVRYLSHAMDLHQCLNHAGLSPLQYQSSAKRKHLRKWLVRARSKHSFTNRINWDSYVKHVFLSLIISCEFVNALGSTYS